MINKTRNHYKTRGYLLNTFNKVKTITSIVLITVTLTACSQESPVDDNYTKPVSNNNSNNYHEEHKDEEKNPEENSDKIEISMEQAISIGMEEASKYYDNLQLTEVHSYDNDQNPEIFSGDDGKRQWWYVNFANEKQNYVSILICNGKIEAVEQFDSNGNSGLLDLEDINLTAEEAVQKAQKMGLRGGNPDNQEEWVTGYNFKMSYASLVDSPEDVNIFLEVIGISPNGNFAHIDFDAVTGEVILAEEEIEYSNGETEWKTFEVDYPDYFTPIIQEIKADDSGVGLYSVMDRWWDRNLCDSLKAGQYVYGEYAGKEYICEINGESYSFDLQDALVGTGKWNWWMAGVFLDEEEGIVYICLNNAFLYYEDIVQTPQLLLIEFPTEKPEEYQVWSYEVEPQNLCGGEVRKCYRLGNSIFIAGEEELVSIDLNTKQLRYYTEERLALENFVDKKYGEEGYQAVFFRAVYEQEGVTVYSVHVSEAFDVQPVAVVYVAVQNEEIISYMSIDLTAEYMEFTAYHYPPLPYNIPTVAENFVQSSWYLLNYVSRHPLQFFLYLPRKVTGNEYSSKRCACRTPDTWYLL